MNVHTATLVVLAVLLVAAGLLVAVAVVQGRLRRRPVDTRSALPSTGRPAPRTPVLGSPAQVWLERGERVAQRLRRLGTEYPVLTGVGDDADAVLTELRAAASEVAGLDAARSRLPAMALQAEQRRLDDAIAAAPDDPAAHDLRVARDAVAARLALAGRHRAATGALLARMRAAVAGLEQAEDELAGLLAAPSDTAATATAELADRLAGLRAGLAEVRTITARVASRAQGEPGDLPGSVEPPPRT